MCGPAGPRRAGEGVTDQQQGILGIEPANGCALSPELQVERRPCALIIDLMLPIPWLRFGARFVGMSPATTPAAQHRGLEQVSGLRLCTILS